MSQSDSKLPISKEEERGPPQSSTTTRFVSLAEQQNDEIVVPVQNQLPTRTSEDPEHGQLTREGDSGRFEFVKSFGRSISVFVDHILEKKPDDPLVREYKELYKSFEQLKIDSAEKLKHAEERKGNLCFYCNDSFLILYEKMMNLMSIRSYVKS